MRRCGICGEPMPPGEEMFFFHGYSGPCPKPPLPKPAALQPPPDAELDALTDHLREVASKNGEFHVTCATMIEAADAIAALRRQVAEEHRITQHYVARVNEEREHAEKAERELERERIRLAACGVIAMANTAETAARAREMAPEYRSASADDVAAAVDREMKLRDELAAARQEIEALKRQVAIERLKNQGSLANNLCPDHRDKQVGRPCLACLLEKAERELAEEKSSFDLRWKADQHAIKMWHAAHPGNELVWPDHADLCVWLLEQLAAARELLTHAGLLKAQEETVRLRQEIEVLRTTIVKIRAHTSHLPNAEAGLLTKLLSSIERRCFGETPWPGDSEDEK